MTDTAYKAEIEEDLPIMVSVTAPSTLPPGYTFEAFVNDDKMRPFTATVPESGVNEGDTFMVPLPTSAAADRINAPTGRWKDGLFDCFSVGICHPSLCCAVWCSRIAMAQVMTRMSLTWLGEPGQRISTKETFKVVVLLYVAYITFDTAFGIASVGYAETIPDYITASRSLGGLVFSIYSLYSLCRTRQNVRRQYSIPEEHCVGCEDLACAMCCSCCAISQMARHTGEYETYPGVCCSKTGHPEGTPLTV